jgi:eukaryotic-like serine/threonine-protein kinase
VIVSTDRTESVFATAVALTTEAERAAYLDEACAGEPALRTQVEALIRAHLRAGHLLDRPVPGGLGQTGAYCFPPERPGAVIAGRYKLLEALGEGGMGAVWIAEQTQPVRRKVAMKLIKAGMDSKTVLARFEAERQALAVMDHPNIAKVLDGGLTETGRPFFVMEYVKGVPITEYCEATRLSVSERLSLFVQVCHAVQHAHHKGIIHRDLKPSNILVAPYDDKPVPKVIDFGLAKAMHQSLTDRTLHTAHETVLGTPLYMSPEQAQLNNLDVDTRSDIYSLGVLLYELLTGTTPLDKERFKQAAWDEIRRSIREEEPPRPSTRLSSSQTLPSLAAGRQTAPALLPKLVRGELDWIVLKALEKDRNRRYETANAFATDIQRYLTGEPVLAAPPSARYRLRKFWQKHRTALNMAAAITLLLAAGTAISTWQALRATRAETAARRAEHDAVLAQQAETERAEGERLAKLNAEARQADAERLKGRAVASEKLASERLAQVDAEKRKAEEEKRVAQSVRAFLQHKLLGQADVSAQADALLHSGGPTAEAKNNPTIRELLDRAADELAPEKIDANFPKQQLVQAAILQTVGCAYSGVGELERAIGFLQRSMALYRQVLGPDEPELFVSMNNLATAYRAAGKLDLALPLYEESFRLMKAKRGPDHRDTLGIMGNLALAYQAAGKLDLSLSLCEEALQRRQATLGLEHPDTLVSMTNLAGAYWAAGKLDAALPLFEQTLKLRQAKLGPEHPITLGSMNNLAMTYKSIGKLDLALRLFEETLKARQAKLGPDHPDTLVSIHNLATAHHEAGRLDRALPLYEEALKLRKAKLGLEHPDTLLSMNHLATAYHSARKIDLAVPLYKDMLQILKAKRGAGHPDTLGVIGNLALAYHCGGKLDLSLPLYAETLKLMRAKGNLDHPDMLGILGSLAVSYQSAGKWELSLPFCEETLKLRKAKLGPDHPDTIGMMSNLALAYQVIGKFDLSIPLFEEALQLRKAKFGPDHPDTIAGMNNLAMAHYASGKPQLAVPLYEEALKLRQANQGPDHLQTLASMNNLALAYEAAGKPELALPLFEECYRSAKIHPALSSMGPKLLERYVQAGKTEEAAALTKELVADARSQVPGQSPQLAGQLATIAMSLLRIKAFTEAELLLRESLAIREKSQPDDWLTFNTKSMLGGALIGLKKFADAEPLLLTGYEGMKQREATIPLTARARLAEAVERLAQLCEAQDKTVEAARWRTEFEAVKAAQQKTGKQP